MHDERQNACGPGGSPTHTKRRRQVVYDDFGEPQGRLGRRIAPNPGIPTASRYGPDMNWGSAPAYCNHLLTPLALMMILTETIEVPRAVANCFRYVADFRTTVEWDATAIAAKKLTRDRLIWALNSPCAARRDVGTSIWPTRYGITSGSAWFLRVVGAGLASGTSSRLNPLGMT